MKPKYFQLWLNEEQLHIILEGLDALWLDCNDARTVKSIITQLRNKGMTRELPEQLEDCMTVGDKHE